MRFRFPHASSRRLLAGLLAAALLGACGGDSDGGTTAAALKVPIAAADGSSATLADLGGTPLVVNLWATWCSPCVKEMPALDEVASEVSGVRIIGVNVGDDPAAAASFAADLGVSYPQYTDVDGGLMSEFAIANLPATAFIDADGTVLDVHSGAYTADEPRAAIADHFPDLGG